MELIRFMKDNNLIFVLDTINQWWNCKIITPEILRARIASIYQQGISNMQENYRPTSLLNSIYKIWAAMLRKRRVAAIDHIVQNHSMVAAKQDAPPVH